MGLMRISDGVHASEEARAAAAAADSVIFDCDGVLIDVAHSYYGAISATVSHVLGVLNIMTPASETVVTPAITEGFKSLGGFNDEVDLSCAIILGAAAARKTGHDPQNILDQIIKNVGSGGIAEVLHYITECLVDVSEVDEYLEHPHPERNGRLYQIFDQFFFGSDLYRQIRGGTPEIVCDGLIRQDRLLIDARTLSILSKRRFGSKISMVTGRGVRSARYTLEPLLSWFDLKNSAFLEDEPRENAKPNPMRLDDCIKGIDCKGPVIYVGDSVEDLIMSQRSSYDVLFCGITGTSSNPQQRHDLLHGKGATLILDSVLRLPKALNLEEQISNHGSDE